MSQIMDKTMQAVQAALDYRLLKHNVTSGNIANAETPNYKAKVVDFEGALARAVDLNNIAELQNVAPEIGKENVRIEDNPEAEVNNDGNTVNMENEMINLTENSVLYKAALNVINKKLAMLRYGISEGGK